MKNRLMMIKNLVDIQREFKKEGGKTRKRTTAAASTHRMHNKQRRMHSVRTYPCEASHNAYDGRCSLLSFVDCMTRLGSQTQRDGNKVDLMISRRLAEENGGVFNGS